MARAIRQVNGLTIGEAFFGLYEGKRGSVRQVVHDGDTVTLRLHGNLGVRFLGVDAPESSFTLPGEDDVFRSIGSAQWNEFLTDPFDARWGKIRLRKRLRDDLFRRAGAGAAANHHRHAKAAEAALEGLVDADLIALGHDFRFFEAFAHEIMDRYGRLLCYLNRFQESEHEPSPRPRSYNERLLAMGLVTPYFIWPNVDPFRSQSSVLDSVPRPSRAGRLDEDAPSLRLARDAVSAARTAGAGVFAPADPLRVQPFELRYLSRRRPPDRWVIDMTETSPSLHPPQAYIRFREEDRLFVPAEYVPLFESRGWRTRTF